MGKHSSQSYSPLSASSVHSPTSIFSPSVANSQASSPLDTASPSSLASGCQPKAHKKLTFPKPSALRMPLKIKIPLPHLVTSTSAIQLQHARGSLLTRDSRIRSGNHSEYPLSDGDDYDYEQLRTPKIISPASVTSDDRGPRFGLDSLSPSSPFESSSSSSSSSSTSSESDQASLSSASGSSLNSPIACDDIDAFANRHGGFSTLGAFRLSSSTSNSPAAGDSSRYGEAPRPVQNHSQTHNKRTHQGPFRFRFLRSLNNGSYGAAYAVRELDSGRLLCAKVCEKHRALPSHDGEGVNFPEDDSAPNDFLRGVLAEMHAYQRISASKDRDKLWLMDLYGAVQDEGRVLFIMDLMQADLFSLISSPISKGMIRRWIAQVALGIDALHQMGVIHRDIKPENIFVVPKSSCAYVKIGDYTNAWVYNNTDIQGESYERAVQWDHTYSRQYIGTKEYLAPEVHRRDWYGPMVDWWSLGCLVWDLLVGDALFPDERALNFYIKWQRDHKTAQSYLAYRANALMDEDIDLMAGLLALDPLKRFRLPHLETHPFFIESSGAPSTDASVNVFEEMRHVPISSVKKRLEKRSRSGDYPVDEEMRDEPICYASAAPGSREADDTSESDDVKTLRWINPNGGFCC